jgi:hypothetical protein
VAHLQIAELLERAVEIRREVRAILALQRIAIAAGLRELGVCPIPHRAQRVTPLGVESRFGIRLQVDDFDLRPARLVFLIFGQEFLRLGNSQQYFSTPNSIAQAPIPEFVLPWKADRLLVLSDQI